MKVYGPYIRADGRKHVILYENSKLTTVSYPKYLLEQKLGRKLEWNEEADHIDRDKTNDNVDNLQVKIHREHQLEDSIKVRVVVQYCVSCNKELIRKATNIRHNSKKGKAGPFCRSCAGKYGQKRQYLKIEKLPVQISVKSEYYLKPKLIT